MNCSDPRRAPGHLALAALALACAAPVPPALPRIVSAAPTGTVAPDEVRVEIAFSAPVDPAGLVDGRYFALCRREDLGAVTEQAESEVGLAPGAPIVAARVTLDEARVRLALAPEAPLEPGHAWAAVLSRRARSAEGRPLLDPDGRARTFALLFETGPARDRAQPQARWILPPNGPVPANLAALRVGFDEPVAGPLALGPGGPPAQPLAIAPDVLGLELGGPLSPGPLPLDVAQVHDEAGNPALPPAPLEVSPCSAEAPLELAEPRLLPGELKVNVEATLRGMGRLLAELSALPGAEGCGAAPLAPASAVVVGEVSPCPGWDPCNLAAAACPAAVELGGLCPGVEVQVRLASEDLAGHRGEPGPWLRVAPLPPRPAPVLTEVLADAATPEAGGEYVEVANVGTGPADLAGFSLAKRTASGAFTRCVLEAMAGGPVAVGGHALLVGGAYDGRYALAAGVALYRCGKTTLVGGLANDRPVALALEDRSGAVVSSAGIAEAVQRCPQGSLERVHPTGPDAAANFACPGATTPGACNRSTPPEECPRKGW